MADESRRPDETTQEPPLPRMTHAERTERIKAWAAVAQPVVLAIATIVAAIIARMMTGG